ncbi:MAG: cell surface protein SprA [Microscillaceae bacterium]|nr:cell surface protein SprA [Microscillaceae bacterium]MDW8460596.1 cell surface protein SprA [Cytophagales bacterium]
MLSVRYLLPLGLVCLSVVSYLLEQQSHTFLWWTRQPFQDSLLQKQPDSVLFLQKTLLNKKILLADTGKKYKASRFPTYYIKDRRGDALSVLGNNQSRFLQNNPTLFKPQVIFQADSTGRKYIIEEKSSRLTFKPSAIFSETELNEILDRRERRNFWRNNATGLGQNESVTAKGLIPKIPVTNKTFGEIFGPGGVEFKPTGFVNLDFAIQSQRIANPTLPIRQQRITNFNFDPHANVSIVGKVGSKLQIRGNYDTKASFQFENNYKVDYKAMEEDILQKIDFGNVSFPLSTQLIQGVQNVFGISSELKFGRLTIKSVFGNQRGRADQISLRGGSQRRNFEIRCDNYDENRHFFLGQFFRDRYESSLSTLPVINSGIQITRIEVYTTNRNNNTETLRSIVALLDLGESVKAHKPNLPIIAPINPSAPADNKASNQLLPNLLANPNVRKADNVTNEMANLGLARGEDYELLRSARRMSEREYTFNRELGYISLLTPLRNDEVLAVSFEYTYNGQTYKVGEMSEDYQSRPQDEVIFLKMLRPSAIRLDLPTWDLMMKNIYLLNATQINRQNFQLRVVYKDDLTGLDNPTLQEGIKTKDVPLLQLLKLDQLNPQNDPIRDGNFDFVENVTIDSKNGRIIFPVLEPFGSHLEKQFDPLNEAGLINKYVFTKLYRTTKADALQTADKNKFFLVGSFEGTASNNVNLPGLNISPGSVRVMAGNVPLVEGKDYTVDYATGQVNIINEAYRESNKDVRISYEKADLFQAINRRVWGTRFDYTLSKDMIFGATAMNLRERPVITRVNVGDEPINNTIWGLDATIRTESRFLTRLVDKLPLVQTKEKSTINFYGEVAQLRPGYSPLSGARSLIDDFEGSRLLTNLVRNANITWKYGSTPQMFPQGSPSNPLEYNYRRAKMAWYNIDNQFYRDGGLKPANISSVDLQNHYIRAVAPQEIFPARAAQVVNVNEIIFDVAFFPHERGPYNYNPDLNEDGTLKNPKQNFGAITRAFVNADIDFDNANQEFIEFWLLDPFIPGPNGRVIDGRFNTNNTTGGDLYINLGNISEDVLKDGRHAFENGLPPTGATDANTDRTPWGRVTRQQYLNNAFDNNPNSRPNQDVGLDGLNNEQEREFFADFISQLPPLTDEARIEILSDPSADDFSFYLGADKDRKNAKILERYKSYNGLENNTPVNNSAASISPAGSNLPDNEDLNIDNTLNTTEEYYQYKISLTPQNLRVGSKYIVDRRDTTINGDRISWYLFRIPIREPDARIGNIQGFKTIRFMRLFLTNFEQPVVLRFAQFQLVANQWRRYLNDLRSRDLFQPSEPYDAQFVISTVNIEENGSSGQGKVPYVLAPGVIRDTDITTINNMLRNEQSLQLCIGNLRNGDARAAFKNVNLDFINYKRLKMFVHAQSQNARDDEMTAFVRLGTDFTDNYYEVEVPLKITPFGISRNAVTTIWNPDNEIDIALKDLINVKVERNRQPNRNLLVPFTQKIGKYNVTVVGNPDYSAIQVVMIGVRNPDLGAADDGNAKQICLWVNELRVTDYDQTAGWAATTRAEIKLADFAQVTGALKYTTFGFGSINQKIPERARANTLEYDVASTIAIDKFLPDKWNWRIPLFISQESKTVTPRFNPLDPDVPFSLSLTGLPTNVSPESYRAVVEERNTRNSINLTNIRKVRKAGAKVDFFDIENFTFTWALSEERRSNMSTAEYFLRNERYAIAYVFDKPAKHIEPFKKFNWLNSKYFAWVKDFNFSLFPNNISIRGDLDRRFARTQLRGADLTTRGVQPFFEKAFLFNRVYDVRWDISKSLNINYNATVNAIIDEPFGNLDTQEKRDSVWNNLLNLGRIRNFNQRTNFTYRLPINKFPTLDWITANATLNTGYTWTAGALRIADTLGNNIQNNAERGIDTRLDMVKLYKKLKFYTWLEATGKPQAGAFKPAGNIPKADSAKNKKEKKLPEYRLLKFLLRPLFSLKTINFKYSLQEQTQLPGFMPRPRFLGMDTLWQAPGWDFVFGGQNSDIRFKAAKNGWLAPSSFLNVPFRQTRQENITISGRAEPFPDMVIDLDVRRSRGTTYQEFFRRNPSTLQFESQSPVRNGTFTGTYIFIRTLLQRNDGENKNAAFRNFEAYRSIIRERLRSVNTAGTGDYSLNSQDVLVPAFLSAYTGKKPNKQILSPFPAIPLPNWKITYNGLNKLPFFKNIFASFNLTHSYSATYAINNFTSSLEYGFEFVNLSVNELNYLPPFIINAQGEYVPIFVLGQVNVNEKINLLGIDFKTKSNLTFSINYDRERTMSLNIANAQMAEALRDNFTMRIGYMKKNLKLPIKSEGKFIVLKNDVNFNLRMTVNDTKTIQRQLDDIQTITQGNLNVQLRPDISYVVNQQLTLQFYFEQNINTPRVSNAFPRRATSGGIQLRYTIM